MRKLFDYLHTFFKYKLTLAKQSWKCIRSKAAVADGSLRKCLRTTLRTISSASGQSRLVEADSQISRDQRNDEGKEEKNPHFSKERANNSGGDCLFFEC